VYLCTYVRMCVCAYLRMCVRSYARMCVCAYVRKCVCAYVRMCVRAYVRTCVYAYVRKGVCACSQGQTFFRSPMRKRSPALAVRTDTTPSAPAFSIWHGPYESPPSCPTGKNRAEDRHLLKETGILDSLFRFCVTRSLHTTSHFIRQGEGLNKGRQGGVPPRK